MAIDAEDAAVMFWVVVHQLDMPRAIAFHQRSCSSRKSRSIAAAILTCNVVPRPFPAAPR
jgi:hypothetical protein